MSTAEVGMHRPVAVRARHWRLYRMRLAAGDAGAHNPPLAASPRDPDGRGVILNSKTLWAGMLSAACALTGCGGDSSSTPPPPTVNPPPAPAPPPVNLPPLTSDTEIRVSADSTFAAGCSTGAGTEYRNAEVEPQVAINPLDSGNLIINWQQDRWSAGGASGVVAAVTTDGGVSWTRAPLPASRCGGGNAGNGGDYARATDPWVTFGPTGVAYQMALAFNGGSLQPGSVSAMLVSRSTDGGRSWGPLTPLIVSDSNFFNDKNSITADPTDARFVYAVWDRLALAGGGPTLLARTTDGGSTWEAATVIYDPGPRSQTIGNQIVVLPNGTLVNVFTQIDPGANGTLAASIRVIRSTDRGVSWSAPVKVNDLLAVGARDPVTRLPIRDGSIIPEIAVAPNGNVLVVWQDARFSGGTFDGIALSRSTDGGSTWSAPLQVNSARSVAAFTPTVRARADGTIGVSYYDLRSDTADTATLPTDLMLARSTDLQTWTEVRLTPTFDLATAPQAGGYFLGDYFGLAASGNVFVPVYVRTTGSSTNRTDVYLQFARSIATAAATGVATRQASARTAPPVDEATRVRASDNLARVMERRLPGWTRWREQTTR